jgi:hypothetical protein
MTQQKSKRFDYKQFDNIKLQGGIIDYRDLKSCYLEMSGHVLITDETPTKKIRKVLNKCKKRVFTHIYDSVFKEKFIITPLIPETFDDRDGGFISVEYTFFVKGTLDYKIIRGELEKIASLLNDEVASDTSMTIIRNKPTRKQNEKN